MSFDARQRPERKRAGPGAKGPDHSDAAPLPAMASRSAGPRRMLITAGPTHEPIDAVRYVANRSSGRMGLALADAARENGWAVTLLLGPVALEPPGGVLTIRFESAAELAELLDQHFAMCDVLIMAAAVADYRPRASQPGKFPRSGDRLMLELEPTPDLVASCAARKRTHQRIVGFALEEPAALAPRAREKLHGKGLDAIVANPLSTMGASEITATVFTANGKAVAWPRAQVEPPETTKVEFARWLIEWIGGRW